VKVDRAPADRVYASALRKIAYCERRTKAEQRELRRRRLADGSYPVLTEADLSRKLDRAPQLADFRYRSQRSVP
jgi:hypothetical protein